LLPTTGSWASAVPLCLEHIERHLTNLRAGGVPFSSRAQIAAAQKRHPCPAPRHSCRRPSCMPGAAHAPHAAALAMLPVLLRLIHQRAPGTPCHSCWDARLHGEWGAIPVRACWPRHFASKGMSVTKRPMRWLVGCVCMHTLTRAAWRRRRLCMDDLF